MTVLSRVLYGDLKVKTYDIIPAANYDDDRNDHDDDNNSEEEEDPYMHDKSWLPNFVSRVLRSSSSENGLHSASISKAATINANNTTTTTNNIKQIRVPKNSIHVYKNKIQEISSPQITEFYPELGNLHEFTAGPNGAAVLDVLLPPYDCDNDRDCTFYKEDLDLDLPQLLNNDHFDLGDDVVGDNDVDHYVVEKECDKKKRRLWLVPIEQPEWFECVSGHYGHIGR